MSYFGGQCDPTTVVSTDQLFITYLTALMYVIKNDFNSDSHSFSGMDCHHAREPLHQMGRPLSRSANQHGQAGVDSQERGFIVGVP